MLGFFVAFDPWFLAFGLVLDIADCAVSVHVGPLALCVYWE